MAYVKEIKPSTVVLEFRQEPGDPDYGSCLWAKFVLDLDAYSLSVLSDCGHYGYTWVPTQRSESFLHLMARVEADYLLDKISSRTVLDTESTMAAFLSLMEENGVAAYNGIDIAAPEDECGIDVGRLESVCGMEPDIVLVDEAKRLFQGTPMESVDDYDFWCCISKDYPLNAKKIASIFEKYIAPKCRELDAASVAAQKEG